MQGARNKARHLEAARSASRYVYKYKSSKQATAFPALHGHATPPSPLSGPVARRHQPILAHSRPRYRPPAAEAHDMGLPRPPKVSATS